jgi:hypothetical protein
VGISAVLYPASDEFLAILGSDTSGFAGWLADEQVERRGISLQDRWRAVDALLGSVAPRPGLPWSALAEGDLSYPTLADRGAHGLRASTAMALSAALSTITSDQIERYARGAWARFAAATGRPPTLTDPQLRSEVSDLVVYLSRLRRVADAACAEGQGLLVARWEDW